MNVSAVSVMIQKSKEVMFRMKAWSRSRCSLALLLSLFFQVVFTEVILLYWNNEAIAAGIVFAILLFAILVLFVYKRASWLRWLWLVMNLLLSQILVSVILDIHPSFDDGMSQSYIGLVAAAPIALSYLSNLDRKKLCRRFAKALLVLGLGFFFCLPSGSNEIAMRNYRQLQRQGQEIFSVLNSFPENVVLGTCHNTEELIKLMESRVRISPTVIANLQNWSIAVNVPEDADDQTPVLVSSNFDPSMFPRKWDASKSPDDNLPISGPDVTRLGDFAVVIVRKSGVAQIVKKKYFKPSLIFGKRSFEFPESLEYIGKDNYGKKKGHFDADCKTK